MKLKQQDALLSVTEELVTTKSELFVKLLKNSASNKKPLTASSFLRISSMLGALLRIHARTGSKVGKLSFRVSVTLLFVYSTM